MRRDQWVVVDQGVRWHVMLDIFYATTLALHLTLPHPSILVVFSAGRLGNGFRVGHCGRPGEGATPIFGGCFEEWAHRGDNSNSLLLPSTSPEPAKANLGRLNAIRWRRPLCMLGQKQLSTAGYGVWTTYTGKANG